MKPIKYITENPSDALWGLSICSVGYQNVQPGDSYPPSGHNEEYSFSPEKGRTLNEYQLLYIASGHGELHTAHAGKIDIKEGDMFLIFPGEWHSYKPSSQTGWEEYWIGFRGANVDHRVQAGFFSTNSPVYHVGHNTVIIDLYRKAIDTASLQEPYFQQLLAGIVNHLLGMMFMTSQNRSLLSSPELPKVITEARMFMQSKVEEMVYMPDVAKHLNISYASFRHLFKKYTGLSPAQYLINLRLHRAKELLRGSQASIKEISYRLQFENPEYFATLFKKKTGVKPSEFRKG